MKERETSSEEKLMLVSNRLSVLRIIAWQGTTDEDWLQATVCIHGKETQVMFGHSYIINRVVSN